MSILKINIGIRNWWEKRGGHKKEEEMEAQKKQQDKRDEFRELLDKRNKLEVKIQELANKYEIDSVYSPIERLTSGFVMSNLGSELIVLVDALVRIHPEVKKEPFVEDFYKRFVAFATDTEEYRKEVKEIKALLSEKVKEI